MRRIILPISALFVGASQCTTDPSVYDRDLDGVANFEDCAPDDPSIYPGAPETCDGVDNNCDSRIDDGITKPYFTDADGDGHGTGEPTVTCTPEAGQVELDDDCDDADADAFPGNLEVCDGIDNDCNERIDDLGFDQDFQNRFDTLTYALSDDARVSSEGTNEFLRLTRAVTRLQGSLLINRSVPGVRWRARFKSRMNTVGTTPGEGLAFVVSTQPFEEVRGGNDADLGIYGANLDGFTVELDAYKNDADDTSLPGKHYAIHEIRTGDRWFDSTRNPPDFTTLTTFLYETTVIFDDGRLTVDARTTRMFDAVELPIETPERVWFGFTATTSDSRASQIAVDDIIIDCPEIVLDTDTDVDTDM